MMPSHDPATGNAGLPNNAALPASQQPLSACPGCSAELCPHLHCRVCAACEECDIAADIREVQGVFPAPPVKAQAEPAVPASGGPACAQHPPKLHSPTRPPMFEQIRGAVAARHSDPAVRRLAYLRSIGITQADLADADRALCELRGDCCACGRRKDRDRSFCGTCFHALSSEMRQKLWLHFTHGYLTHVRAAWAHLRKINRIA